ncbi:MAG: hypothetical protein CM15mP9_3860 [Methanobacteriota archaeon]|nr:MAG: hypothetical protein CM15mP9_3860 [Euryarchaeota archaeon]
MGMVQPNPNPDEQIIPSNRNTEHQELYICTQDLFRDDQLSPPRQLKFQVERPVRFEYARSRMTPRGQELLLGSGVRKKKISLTTLVKKEGRDGTHFRIRLQIHSF